MKFDKFIKKSKDPDLYDFDYHYSSLSGFRMDLDDQRTGRSYISFFRIHSDIPLKLGLLSTKLDKYMKKTAGDEYTGFYNAWRSINPHFSIGGKEKGTLFSLVLKDILSKLKKLSDNPSEVDVRAALMLVAVKYGGFDVNQKSRRNCRIDMQKLNQYHRNRDHQSKIEMAVRSGLRARSLKGKDRRLRELAELLLELNGEVHAG